MLTAKTDLQKKQAIAWAAYVAEEQLVAYVKDQLAEALQDIEDTSGSADSVGYACKLVKRLGAHSSQRDTLAADPLAVDPDKPVARLFSREIS